MKDIAKEMTRTLEMAGCVSLAALQMGMDEQRFRTRLANQLKKQDLPYEHLSMRHVLSTVNQYLDKHRSFTAVRNLMNEAWFESGVAICHIGNTLYARHPSLAQGSIVGIYTADCSKNDMLDDLYWYITNHMEAKDEIKIEIEED